MRPIKDMKYDLNDLEEKAEILKAIAHPIRLCIVRGLIEQKGRNVTNIQTCLEMPQSTVSQHLAKLKAAGIVEGKRSGTEVNYYVINEDVQKVVKELF